MSLGADATVSGHLHDLLTKAGHMYTVASAPVVIGLGFIRSDSDMAHSVLS